MGSSFEPSLIVESIPKLLSYLHITIEILALSVGLGLLLGILIAMPRLYHIPILKEIVTVYISFIRGTPILIQLFLVFYGLPVVVGLFGIDITRMDPFYFVIVTYTLSNAAAFSEIFRGAITSVDYGQTEAAYSIGLTPLQNFYRIVFPQAFRVAFPNIANASISSLKDTSLAFSIGVMDMMGRGETLISATMHAVEIYISLAIIYYVIVLIFERLFKWIERYLNRYLVKDELSL
ncbi:amino acid ABC transporter permease [Ureibacillus acetophenoni]|uniref:Amino acid ABC transporter membrane protein 1 (PAAT family) n=1 Tax=Ureibacillus acetophenoni TaxID=614649 RepID=A0A285UFZ9_9BACL|nr:amino acid ABC transporter permease [Ureibacillus acetophenoni]SOC40732.1 amino acid ABC transporter membrane protein 1 (PAAT family) [Ureibacillus acetophenoni]